MTASGQSTDGAFADLDWRGYDWRCAIPWAVSAAGASAAVMIGRWYLVEMEAFADRVGSLVFFAMVAIVWPALAALFLYRVTTYTYRLTDRAILIDRGPLSLPEPVIWLSDSMKVIASAGPFGRLLGFGRVELFAANGRTILLTGVRNPESFAAAIRRAAAAAS